VFVAVRAIVQYFKVFKKEEVNLYQQENSQCGEFHCF
jgi:hypothetical protein